MDDRLGLGSRHEFNDDCIWKAGPGPPTWAANLNLMTTGLWWSTEMAWAAVEAVGCWPALRLKKKRMMVSKASPKLNIQNEIFVLEILCSRRTAIAMLNVKMFKRLQVEQQRFAESCSGRCRRRLGNFSLKIWKIRRALDLTKIKDTTWPRWVWGYNKPTEKLAILK